MGLTPLDAEKHEFPSGFRGYDRNAVEQFRAAVVAALEGHISENGQLRQRITDLEQRLAELREREQQISSSMALAQKTGDNVIANAREEAELIKSRAQADCQEIRNEMARLRAEREEFEYSFHGLLSGFLHRLEKANPKLGSAAAASQPSGSDSATDEMLAMLSADAAASESHQAGRPEQPVQPQQAAASPPPSPRIQPSRGNEMDRDADIDDFNRALSDAPSATQRPEPAAAPPVMGTDRDMDEDLDISDELQEMDEDAPAVDDDSAWQRHSSAPVSEQSWQDEPAEVEPAADWQEHSAWDAEEQAEPASQRPAGLEEVEGLAPPPPQMQIPDPEEHAPVLDESPVAAPLEQQPRSILSSRLQQSRSSEEQQPSGQQDAAQAGGDRPRSNLDEIFGGVQASQAGGSEDEEEEPYRPDW